jgi:hypothetical protein
MSLYTLLAIHAARQNNINHQRQPLDLQTLRANAPSHHTNSDFEEAPLHVPQPQPLPSARTTQVQDDEEADIGNATNPFNDPGELINPCGTQGSKKRRENENPFGDHAAIGVDVCDYVDDREVRDGSERKDSRHCI